jgi:hypothetical protein
MKKAFALLIFALAISTYAAPKNHFPITMPTVSTGVHEEPQTQCNGCVPLAGLSNGIPIIVTVASDGTVNAGSTASTPQTQCNNCFVAAGLFNGIPVAMKVDINGNLQTSGGGGGSSAFSALTGGTNSMAAMVVGTGASLGTSGSGSINATLLNGSTSAPPNGTAGGDLSGTYPNPTVAKVNGNTPGGTCTNQVVTAISSSAVPTCLTVTSAYVDTSIAKTGTDINTSNQVTVTHLAAALPVAQGGIGSATAGADTVFGNATGSTAAPGFTSAPVVVTLNATTSLSSGSSPPTCTAGTAGVGCFNEGTAPTGASAVDMVYANSTSHCLDALNNNVDKGCIATVTQVAAMQNCGTASTCGHTALTSPQIVMGSAPLVTGTPSTVTISGISPAFTSSTSYVCNVTAQSGAATALISVANVSSSSFTITGPTGVTTVINFICAGN